ncbi:hypothetical protein KP79_PYT08686 [Mizuhopecten yessoensis]|uniref:Uncharacterized protein n=2 Tax=Mizuhopecten yessoensis TaxID=6573 RepID=A0A210PEJ4_MIZYE|nr:hypothetical protein KP79_PYT08686 [Mizuhopecten yessoensis]
MFTATIASIPSSSFLSSSSQLDLKITGLIPLLHSSLPSFSVVNETSTRVVVSHMTMHDAIEGQHFSTSVLSSSGNSHSITEVPVSAKLHSNSNDRLESKTTLHGEQTTGMVPNENLIKSIRPTRSSFFQSQSVRHPANDSARIDSVTTSSINWFSSSYITEVPALNTADNTVSVDVEDKPDSKVALGIVIGVFAIIVAVLLVMIFRVVYRSAMETKHEDMPRATITETSRRESQQGVQIEPVEVGNPFFLNIDGDFSESTTDDDVSNKSDVSLKSISNKDMSIPRSQFRSSTNGRTRQHTRGLTKTHQTTFTDDTGCFKVSRHNRSNAVKDTCVTSHSVNGDIYAVSYKQRKVNRR